MTDVSTPLRHGLAVPVIAFATTLLLGAAAPSDEQTEIERALKEDAEAKARAERDTTAPQPSAPPAAGFLQSMNPDISLVADVALGWFSSRAPLQTGGHDPRQTGFTLQQLELAIGAAVDPYFRFDANIVFAQFGVEIEEVYATSLALPHRLRLRAGQFLTRFGRFNNTHLHSWHFVDQPFVIGRIFGSEGNRGLGAELSYLTPLPWYVELVGSATSASGEGTARSFFGAEDLPVHLPLDLQWTGALKQFFELHDDWSLMWGLSSATGPNPTGHRNRTSIYGTDVYLKYRPLEGASPTVVSLQTELLYRRRQIPRDLLQDLGGYASVFWRFAQRWGVATRYEYGTPAHNLAGRAEGDELDPFWVRDRHRVSANLTFWPSEFSRVRLQGSGDFLGWEPRPSWAVILAFEFFVGAHSAHAF